jgi:hypothetical protein
MQYQDVLICEANESDRKFFSNSLADCFISQCKGIEELGGFLEDSDYDAIFLGRSSVIQLLGEGAIVLDMLSDRIISDGLFMFLVSEDLIIQVKKISLLEKRFQPTFS